MGGGWVCVEKVVGDDSAGEAVEGCDVVFGGMVLYVGRVSILLYSLLPSFQPSLGVPQAFSLSLPNYSYSPRDRYPCAMFSPTFP